ncbi:MAG: dihydrolipoyl dehydrogenase [Sphaerochaetaceae bacterium]
MAEKKDLVVLGGGVGGYTAAFRAADLGRSVTLIEKADVLGGVCLNRGCIPSKTLLHVVQAMGEAKELKEAGVVFDEPTIDIEKIRAHKETTITTLTSGLDQLCKGRKIERIQGVGTFVNNTTLKVETETGESEFTFNDLILAVGSRSVRLPFLPYEDARIWSSTEALLVPSIPKRLLIIGGGIIGLEMAAIYEGLGSEITIVEMTDSIIPPADRDLKQSLLKKIKKRYAGIYTSTQVTKVEALKEHLLVHLEGKAPLTTVEADVVLVAVGRQGNSDTIAIENTSIAVGQKGWITVDEKLRTNVEHIWAIGDVTGDPMLAHRASHQGKVAAEVACKLPSAFTPLSIPSVAYTDPELAWIGLTEQEAKERGIEYLKAAFPWQASGRALTAMSAEGVSKVLFDPQTKRLLGAGIAGRHAGELIGEAILALEMGAVASDIFLSVHPHPTLSETFAVAAELSEKVATDLMNR